MHKKYEYNLESEICILHNIFYSITKDLKTINTHISIGGISMNADTKIAVDNYSKLRNLETYDFKNEAPWEDLRNENNTIKKFLKYKDYYKVNKKFDCDNSNGSCALADNIYYSLWGWCYKSRYTISDDLKDKLGVPWDRLGTDTMNSFSTTYSQALKIDSQDHDTVNININLQKFAGLTHSIGNFTLIPFKLDWHNDKKSFNQYRGANFGKYFVYDYFDLSLKLIKENISEEAFKNYIDTFFLDDYVDKDYEIKPLFKSHEAFLRSSKLDLENPKKFIPQNEAELNEYLVNVINNIELRGRRIVDELEKNRCKVVED
jgi:hypothetical protein